MPPKTFFVTAATSGVGGYLASLLLQQGHTIHALVRTPTSEASKALEAAGVKLFPGSFDDLDAITAAAQGCDGVFLNPSPSFADMEAELRHANNVINGSKSAGVKSCVYMSVNDAGNEANWPSWVMQGSMAWYWRSKSAIQKAVRAAGFDGGYTILQPATFMTNFAADGHVAMLYPSVKEKPVGRLPYAVKPETKIDLIDPKDIAKLAAAAMLDPEGFNRKEIPMSAEQRTLAEITKAMSDACGKEIRAEYADQSQRDSNPFAAIGIWIEEIGSTIDFSEGKRYGIEMGTFEQFLQREKAMLMSMLES